MITTSQIQIHSRGPWPFTNVKTGESYKLISASELTADESNLQRLVSVCNEPEIYDFLFRTSLQGNPYQTENASGFIMHAKNGWSQQSHFTFSSLNAAGEICGAMDIKSCDRNGAEIGYWVSHSHSGIATPGVAAMCAIAEKAGYKQLYAYVKTSNQRSISVLERNGFIKNSNLDHTKDYPRFLFVKKF